MIYKDSVLIIGGTGLLGPYFVDEFSKLGKVITCGKTKGDFVFDLTNIDHMRFIIKQTSPKVIINLAGYTNVDACEKNEQNAYTTNVNIPKNIVNSIDSDTYFIHISTDQVYPNGEGNFKETDSSPVNVYGKTKLLGELESLKHKKSLVLRTNFFGLSRTEGRKSLSDFFEDAFRKQIPINMFSDMIFSPLHMTTLSKIVRECYEKSQKGLFNVGRREGLSKADFGLNIGKHFGLSTKNANIIKSSDILTRAPRALNLSMNVEKIEKALEGEMPTLLNEIQKL